MNDKTESGENPYLWEPEINDGDVNRCQYDKDQVVLPANVRKRRGSCGCKDDRRKKEPGARYGQTFCSEWCRKDLGRIDVGSGIDTQNKHDNVHEQKDDSTRGSTASSCSLEYRNRDAFTHQRQHAACEPDH